MQLKGLNNLIWTLHHRSQYPWFTFEGKHLYVASKIIFEEIQKCIYTHFCVIVLHELVPTCKMQENTTSYPNILQHETFAGSNFVETTLSMHLKGKTYGKPSKYSTKIKNFGKSWTIAKSADVFPSNILCYTVTQFMIETRLGYLGHILARSIWIIKHLGLT